MNALSLVPEQSAPKTLVDFLTPTTKEDLREKRRALGAAEEEVRRLVAKRHEVELALAGTGRSSAKAVAARAAAIALGEAPPPMGPGPSTAVGLADASDLRAAVTGLNDRIQQAEHALADARGAFRRAVSEAIDGEAAEGAAREYVAAAKALGEAWRQLVAVGNFRVSRGDISAPLAVELRTLRIPGSDDRKRSPPSLVAASARLDFGCFVTSNEMLAHTQMADVTELQRAITEQVGGWPFSSR